MDLNPHPPNMDDDPSPVYELAEFAVQKNARILVVLCAWLHSGYPPDSEWDTANIDYWTERVRPLWEWPEISVNHAGTSIPPLALGPSTTRETLEAVEDRETIVVISNRTGIEQGEYLAITLLQRRCISIKIWPASKNLVGLFEKFPPLIYLAGSTFGGCSLVLKCNPIIGTPEIVGVVSRTFEGVRVWDVK